MLGSNARRARQIGDRACHLQHAMKSAGRQVQTFGRSFQQAAPDGVQRAQSLKGATLELCVQATRPSRTRKLTLVRREDARPHRRGRFAVGSAGEITNRYRLHIDHKVDPIQ